MVQHNTVFDSNAWIALFDDLDSTHKEAIRVSEIHNTKIYIPDFILMETASVLKYKVSFDIAEKFVRFALDNNDIEILHTSLYLQIFAKAFIKTCKNKLSFIDSSLVEMSKEYEVITFDKELLRAIGAHKK